jgi:hypothetical protein
MTDKPPYARNCAFNQCIQPQICDASNACVWNAGDVPMIDGTIVGDMVAPKIKPNNPSIVIDPKPLRGGTSKMIVKDDPFDDTPTRIAYIVWNAARTEGYITFDQQVAYEARKGAESNCFDEDGTQMKLAQAFCNIYSCTESATKQVVVISEPPEYPGD